MDSTPAVTPPVLNDVKRLGDTHKCPACGSEVDTGAYHCPRCRNYFCYRCRARVLATHPQFQCLNQECDYHGKLVCGTCDPEFKKDEEPTIYLDRVGGWWPTILACTLILFLFSLFYISFLAAISLSAIAFAGIAYGLHRAGLNVFDTVKKIVEPRQSVHHNCVRCAKPVKATQ